MKTTLTAVVFGMAFGFVLSWARLSDPAVIREMLLLREPYVFLVMGSAIVVAAIGLRLLRITGSRALVTGERIEWSVQQPKLRHVIGSVIFGAGWSVAGTCPGPVAAMIGEGKLGGVAVAAGLLAGVAIQPILVRSRAVEQHAAASPHPVGL